MFSVLSISINSPLNKEDTIYVVEDSAFREFRITVVNIEKVM